MIKYASPGFGLVLAQSATLLKAGLCQTSFVMAFTMAIPPALVSAVLKAVDLDIKPFLDVWTPEASAYSTFSFLLGFFIVFHTGQAYARYLKGGELIYHVMGDLFDVASLLFSFCRYSKAPADAVFEFQHTLIRLMSLLFAVSVGELEEDPTNGGDALDDDECEGIESIERRAYNHQLIDVGGLDAVSLSAILNAKHREEAIYQLLQNLIIDHISTGILCIPPPLLTRAFQELGNGMINVHEVRAFKEVLFPFPLIAATEVLLIVHWLATPMFVSAWCKDIATAGCLTFVSVFIFWYLHKISLELDTPFGNATNDLNTERMQKDLNSRLLSLLAGRDAPTPQLSKTAVTIGLEMQYHSKNSTLANRSFVDLNTRQETKQCAQGSSSEAGSSSRRSESPLKLWPYQVGPDQSECQAGSSSRRSVSPIEPGEDLADLEKEPREASRRRRMLRNSEPPSTPQALGDGDRGSDEHQILATPTSESDAPSGLNADENELISQLKLRSTRFDQYGAEAVGAAQLAAREESQSTGASVTVHRAVEPVMRFDGTAGGADFTAIGARQRNKIPIWKSANAAGLGGQAADTPSL